MEQDPAKSSLEIRVDNNIHFCRAHGKKRRPPLLSGFVIRSVLGLLLAFPLSAKADEIQLIEATYQQTKTLTAEFTQSTYVPILEKTIVRAGRLFYQNGGKLRIEYAGDPMTHYITDGRVLWIKNPKTKEIQTIPLQKGGLPKEALKFLTEMGNLSQYFKIAPQKKSYKLTPKTKTTYHHLDATFGADHFIEKLTLHTHERNTSTYQFFNRIPNKPLPKKLFEP